MPHDLEQTFLKLVRENDARLWKICRVYAHDSDARKDLRGAHMSLDDAKAYWWSQRDGGTRLLAEVDPGSDAGACSGTRRAKAAPISAIGSAGVSEEKFIFRALGNFLVPQDVT